MNIGIQSVFERNDIMIYIVRSKDYHYNNRESIFYCGYSSNPNIAQKYLELRQEKDKKDYKVKYDIIMMSDEKFETLRKKDPALYLASEIDQIADGSYVSDSDYEVIEQSLAEKVSDMQYHFRESIKVLKLFNDKECRKLAEDMKKLIKRIDKDYEGEDFWDKVDYERVVKKINL